MNKNTYKTLFSYRKKVKKNGPYFIYFFQKKILNSVIVEKKNIKFIKKMDFEYDTNILKGYILNYCFDQNFNLFITYPSIKNVIKVNLHPEFIAKDINNINFIIILLIHKLIILKDFIQCNIFSLNIIFKTLFQIKEMKIQDNEIIYFHDLRENNTITTELPSFLDYCTLDEDINPSKKKKFFCSNYTNKFVVKKNIVRGDFLTKKNLLVFVKKLIKLNTIFVCYFFNDKAHFNLLYKEYFKKIIVDSSLNHIDKCSIIFSNSYMGYTPPWACGDKKKNFLIFYSTNFGYNFDKISNKLLFPLAYENMSWDRIYVWDDIQKNVLSKYNKKIKYKIIKKINFIDNGKDINFDKNYFNIVIFDVTPKNLLVLVNSLNIGDNFYNQKYMIKFINNILLFDYEKVRFYIKQKREIDNVAKGYFNNLKKLIEGKKITLLDEAISPERLIKEAHLVISPVYSTPSLIAKHIKIPSIYYDPEKKVDKNFKYNRGIPIISGKENLQNAILSYYKKWNK